MQKLKQICKNRKKTSLFCAGLLYLGFSFMLPDCVNSVRNLKLRDKPDAPRYLTEEQMRTDLEKEKKKLGLENVVIRSKFVNDGSIAYAGPLVSGKGYLLVLGKGRNIDALQHELWHIYEFEQGILSKSFLYELINPLHPTLAEWRATTYALEAPNK